MSDTLHFRYDESSGQISDRYWGDSPPSRIVSPADGYGYASEDAFSQASRDQLIGEAKNSVDAGTDYDPETETPVAYLYYDDQIGEIFADVEIKPLEDEDQ